MSDRVMQDPERVETVTCAINGVEVTAPKGTNIIEAAELAGIGVPHYCYHPGLSAPAMCRMCLVEVEGAPKLMPGCVTPIGDGQVIRTESEKAREARTGVLEFYLLNHPLDCPVCDKSGECKLQDYVHDEGRKHGRLVQLKRVLGRDDFGGDVIYDGDRCIMCTRCVRFMREIAGEDRLCVVQRGDRSVIDTFFEEGVAGNLWADNIIDICPVGALLSKDFHHKARVWDLDRTPSICPNCSQGCNIALDTRDDLVMRLRPRHNPEVNSHWMCDYGRLSYEWLNRGARVGEPLRGAGPGARAGAAGADAAGSPESQPQPISWQDAIVTLVARLRELKSRGVRNVTVVGSPMHANEDNALLARLADVLGGGRKIFRSARAADEAECPGFPTLARRRDLVANTRGLELLGFERIGDDQGNGGIDDEDGVVIVLADELRDAGERFATGAELFVYLGVIGAPVARNADFVLPVTTFAEQEGTFTNHEGRVQRFWPALQAPTLARPAWQVLGVLLAGLDDGPAPATASDAFLRAAQLHEAFDGLDYVTIGASGAPARTPAGAGASDARGSE
ncbi:MAG: 2Fe-2S iron-sulfur cluster-binding protein [Longimicrobiales bacterium]